MKISRRNVLAMMAAAGPAALSNKLSALAVNSPANPKGRVATSQERELAAGPFQPTWESLEAQYKTPEWFRDAKFGIWAHWSAQCVPEAGRLVRAQDVHPGRQALRLPRQDLRPPSKFGFMEIDNLWKAENWQPEELMDLYVPRARNTSSPWPTITTTSTTTTRSTTTGTRSSVGPKKDIIGTWAEICAEPACASA